ncbi:uncharacterized protein C6orf118-like [Cyprinodon tularosa]|uniref:uncharacterized protein C6orf118-like n=1 Tax=Cyprinodon tularosa TaxID=77115 RepID=UPI0018E238F0|nr:uncharacterized protein C6orf118-like [Cyprinodon tularosa]
MQNVREGDEVAELYERKLQELKTKLSAPSWPSRDRLAVFSDVFDDVCEGLPVFGRILREIKTEYDLYINHLMDSQSSKGNMVRIAADEVKQFGEIAISDKAMDEAEKKVCRIEEKTRRALRDYKWYYELTNLLAARDQEQNSIKNTSLCRAEDSGTATDHTNIVKFRRLQVLNMQKEIQQMEQEIQKRLASTAASERRVQDLKEFLRESPLWTKAKAVPDNLPSINTMPDFRAELSARDLYPNQ